MRIPDEAPLGADAVMASRTGADWHALPRGESETPAAVRARSAVTHALRHARPAAPVARVRPANRSDIADAVREHDAAAAVLRCGAVARRTPRPTLAERFRACVALHGKAAVAAQVAPLAPHGGDRSKADGAEQGDNVTLPPSQKGNSAEYLAARLRRDAPEIADALAEGKYRSVRAAARAAGIVKPVDHAKQATKALAQLTPDVAAQVARAFVAPVASAKPAPPRAPVTALPAAPMADDAVDDIVARAQRLSAPEFQRLMKRLRAMEES